MAYGGEEHQLWAVDTVTCVMISCCAGAELQMRRGDEVLLRELYPTKSDLYDRARELKKVHGSGLQPRSL